MKGDLSVGILEGNTITCPNHHAKFDVTTGKAVAHPKMGLFHPKVSDATIYQVKVENQEYTDQTLNTKSNSYHART